MPFLTVVLPLLHRNLLISWGIVLCVAMLAAGVVTNRRQGGEWRDLPIYYTPAAQYLYFGGMAIYLAAVVIAKILS